MCQVRLQWFRHTGETERGREAGPLSRCNSISSAELWSFSNDSGLVILRLGPVSRARAVPFAFTSPLTLNISLSASRRAAPWERADTQRGVSETHVLKLIPSLSPYSFKNHHEPWLSVTLLWIRTLSLGRGHCQSHPLSSHTKGWKHENKRTGWVNGLRRPLLWDMAAHGRVKGSSVLCSLKMCQNFTFVNFLFQPWLVLSFPRCKEEAALLLSLFLFFLLFFSFFFYSTKLLIVMDH